MTNLMNFYQGKINITQQGDAWADSINLALKRVFDKIPNENLKCKLKNIGELEEKLKELMKEYLRWKGNENSGMR